MPVCRGNRGIGMCLVIMRSPKIFGAFLGRGRFDVDCMDGRMKVCKRFHGGLIMVQCQAGQGYSLHYTNTYTKQSNIPVPSTIRLLTCRAPDSICQRKCKRVIPRVYRLLKGTLAPTGIIIICLFFQRRLFCIPIYPTQDGKEV